MSLAVFRERIHQGPMAENDRNWFPKWVARYADGKSLTSGFLPVTLDLVVEFSRSLLKSGTPAWQRLQGVRAIEAYRDLVLRNPEPCLKEIKSVLGRLAANERDSGGPGVQDEKKIIGSSEKGSGTNSQMARRVLRTIGS